MRRSPQRKRTARKPSGRRGAVAIETALAMTVVMLVLVGGVTLGHAVTVRHVLSSATARAARVCTVAGGDIAGCMDDQVRAELLESGVAGRCPDLAIEPEAIDLAGIPAVRVSATCGYEGMPGAAWLSANNVNDGLVLTARATMPLP